MTKMKKILILTVTILSYFLSGALQAENLSSRWIADQYSRSRLFVGGYDRDSGILHLGWQITLKEGWKTYWRSPGEAGLPPRWTWKDARNIRTIAVKWPLPELLHIFNVDTFVYHNEVILPIEVTVADDNKPVSLSLDLQYLICADICIPRKGDYSLDLSSLKNMEISPYQAAQLDRYRALVPAIISDRQVVVKQAGNGGLHIGLPENLDNVANIIVETSDGLLSGRAVADGKRRFTVPYTKSLKGQSLTLTLLLKNGEARELAVTVR